ncbi:MAG: TetR/AcrR family transcriptional regulator [Myxococcota bacterium]
MSSPATRELLLATAWRLMREDAPSASMARIAKEAGVSRQAVYLHFETRAGLLLALVRWTDERERFFDRLDPVRFPDDPRRTLEGYVRVWLDYLPTLHPVPGYLARAKHDPAARAAWADRMVALEKVYAEPIGALHRAGELRRGLGPKRARGAVRAIASVHAWEHLAVDQGWPQKRCVDTLWRGAEAAILPSR